MQFKDFALVAELIAVMDKIGFQTPTPIQEKSIPPALEGRDVLGIAQTGTGKTAAFLLPLISIMAGSRARARMPRAIILAPTRELAAQAMERCDIFLENIPLNTALLIGGTSSKAQEKKIDNGVDILIATPGRFIDHFERGKLLLSDVQHLVIDEADRMLDMGFIPDVNKICAMTPFTKQTLLFSATMPDDITKITHEFMSNPVTVEIAPQSTTNENVVHEIITVPEMQKRTLLRHIITKHETENVIVFCNSKKGASALNDSMIRHGFSSAVLHGDIPQNIRTSILDNFKNKNLKYLIATDIAARGIDVSHISHVINFDLPFHAEDYVHRIGRTGRAGRSGIAFSFFNQADERQANALVAVEKFIQKEIEKKTLEDFGLSTDTRKSAPHKKRSSHRDRPKRAASQDQPKEASAQETASEKPAKDSRHPHKKDVHNAVKTLDYDPVRFTDCEEIPNFLR